MSLNLRDRFPYAVAPSEWGSIVDYDAKVWRPWNENKWILHWGGTPVLASAAKGDPHYERVQLRAWERYHVNSQGWRGIAYNWAIGNSGTLYRLRGDNANGATSGDYEPNDVDEFDEGVAVVFIVGTGQTVTDAAFATFRDMWAAVPELELVIGHRDVWRNSGTGSNTSCPGDQLAAWIDNDEYVTGGNSMYVHEGQTGPWVEYWQKALGVTRDGVYGPDTVAAVAFATSTDGRFIGAGEAEAITATVRGAVWDRTLGASHDNITAWSAYSRIYGARLSPSADEIAAAVVAALPPASGTGELTPETIEAIAGAVADEFAQRLTV
jgi:hypothetical protein